VSVLRRLLGYAAEKFGLPTLLKQVTETPLGHDNRQFSTHHIVSSLLIMGLCRMGSFKQMEDNKERRLWQRIMGRGAKVCGADTLGRRSDQIDIDSLRSVLLSVNRRMRRSKSLRPFCKNGLRAIIVDGHEIGCSYLHDFGKHTCLQREVEFKDGTRTQYYQRLVTAVLVCEGSVQLLDIEMQLPAEDEVACALRLITRLNENYGHLFDIVLADGLYAQAPFFKAVRAMNKHLIAVLKDERRDLVKDMRRFIPLEHSIQFKRGQRNGISVQAWDIQNLESWPQFGQSVRVVRTLESSSVLKQATKKKKERRKRENKESEWMWVTTLSPESLATEDFVNFAHHRWDIENRCFNELTTYWHADHFYRYDFNAIQVIWLILFLAYNIFHVFFMRNLKMRISKKQLANLINANFISDASNHCCLPDIPL
jgi:hypothetical protein